MNYLISQENYNRLVDNVINGAQPPLHMSVDWFGHVPDPLIYPLKVYRTLQELKHANTSSDSKG